MLFLSESFELFFSKKKYIKVTNAKKKKISDFQFSSAAQLTSNFQKWSTSLKSGINACIFVWML